MTQILNPYDRQLRIMRTVRTERIVCRKQAHFQRSSTSIRIDTHPLSIRTRTHTRCAPFTRNFPPARIGPYGHARAPRFFLEIKLQRLGNY
jgi:hypothetical protein